MPLPQEETIFLVLVIVARLGLTAPRVLSSSTPTVARESVPALLTGPPRLEVFFQ